MSFLRKSAKSSKSNRAKTIQPQDFHRTGLLEDILTPSPLFPADDLDELDFLDGDSSGGSTETVGSVIPEDLTGGVDGDEDLETSVPIEDSDTDLDAGLEANDGNSSGGDGEALGEALMPIEELDDEDLDGEDIEAAIVDDSDASETPESLTDGEEAEAIDAEETSEAVVTAADVTSSGVDDSEADVEVGAEPVGEVLEGEATSAEVMGETSGTDPELVTDLETDLETDLAADSDLDSPLLGEELEETLADDTTSEVVDADASVEDEDADRTELDEEEELEKIVEDLLESTGFTLDLQAIDAGVFTVGGDGLVGIDFLYDGGGYKGQLAIFSLEGLDGREFESFDDFIAETVDRASSNSDRGYLVINDKTEGAKFASGENSGDYAGVKLFAMKAGDTFAVMLVPNSTLAAAADGESTSVMVRPLYSLSTANPDDELHVAQIADVTGDGSTFVMEDMSTETKTDRDYNDIIFQVRGATGKAEYVGNVVEGNFFETDMGKAVKAYAAPYVTPESIPSGEESLGSIDLDAEIIDEGGVDPADDIGILEGVEVDGDAPLPLDNTELDILNEELDILNEESVIVDDEWLVTPEDGATESDVIPEPLFEPKDTMFVSPKIPDAPIANQPLIGIIDTGFAINNPDINYENITLGTDFVDGDANPLLFEGEGSEHGTHVLGIIAAEQDNGEGIDGINDDAPIWLGRAIGSGKWADSLVEFVNHAIESEQPNAVVNLSLDLTQIDANGNVTTRYELTPTERAAIEYARQSNVLLVVGAGNDGGVMSALGQASQEFDNIITVGAAERVGEEFADAKAFDRAGYSSYGQGLNILAPGGTVENPELSLTDDGVGAMAGTSVATAKVTGAISQVWAANPALSYRQVIEIVKDTATDLGLVGFDNETSAGLLNQAAAVLLAKVTVPEVHVAPSSVIPDSWSGEGSYIAGERAVATQFNGKYYEWKSYKIVSGDTLGAIAQRTMGNGSAAYYNFIAQKNGIANPNLISVGQTIQVPYEVAPPVVTQPQVGRGSRSPQIFQAAYNKINGTSQGLKLQGDAYRWGNGWTQKFWDKNGSEMLLMLEDGASEAFWMWYGNLGEYQQMGGAIGHLGYPRSNEIALPNKPAGSIYQVFATGNGKSRIHYSPKTGSIATWGSIGRQYTDLGGAYHWLGMPTRREYAYGSDTIFSDFEGGKIAHQKSTGRVEVLRPGQTPSWLNQPTNLLQTLAGKKILLDPGHGITSTGFDPGAVGNGTTEAIENLHQAKLIADHLRKLGADVKVLDEPLSLSQIGQRAAGNDIFVSLHQNAFNKSVQGHEVLYKPNGNPKNIQLAQIINNELDKAFPDSIIPNRNIKPRNDLSVLNNALNSVPTVLVESLFIDSSGMSRANVEKAAIAVASGIEKFFTGNVTSNGSNASVPQAPLATPGQTRQYIIKSGDTLSGIALRELGNAERWREIKKANGSTFTEAEARNLQVGQSVYLPVSYQSGTGTPVTSSPTSTPKTTNNINWVNFSGTVGPSIGVNLRNSPKFSNRSSFNEPYNKTLEFDGWTYGETGTDMWTGQPDNRWFKIKGKNLWVPSCYIWGNPPSNGGGDNGNGGSNTVPNPLLTRQGISYFTSRSQFYGASGNGYAKHGFGSSVNGTNAYREGNCTWYAYGRLKELGVNPDNIMNGYPHANEWGKSLRNGATIVSSPKAGDVAQWHLNGQNHVAIVEKVEGNYIWISESQAYGDYDGNLPGSEIYPGAGTLHRVMKYTKNVPHRYIRL